jgi:transposase
MSRKICPRCQNRRLYKVRRGKKRCSRCGYEFKPRIVKDVRLSEKQWQKILEWFVLERSGLWTAEKTGLGKNLIYKAFSKIRKVMLKDVPGIFSGTVEVDETYLGGQKKNKRKLQLLKDKLEGKVSKRGFGTAKQPVFGILCRSGKVFARLVDNVEAKDLMPIIKK